MRKLAGCFAGSCPSVHELDDGRLQITGEWVDTLHHERHVEATIIVNAELIVQAMQERSALLLDNLSEPEQPGDRAKVASWFGTLDAAPNPYDPLTPDMPNKPDVSNVT